jgi:hypothetical protein
MSLLHTPAGAWSVGQPGVLAQYGDEGAQLGGSIIQAGALGHTHCPAIHCDCQLLRLWLRDGGQSPAGLLMVTTTICHQQQLHALTTNLVHVALPECRHGTCCTS